MIPSNFNNTCPVPMDQQPSEEYKNLLNCFFFGLLGLQYRDFLLTLLKIWLICLSIFLPIVFSNFSFLKNALFFVSFSFLLPDFFIILILLNSYLSCSYVVQRLLNSVILYEESGWYDGQIWVKTPEMLIQNRLVAFNQAIPLLHKIKILFVWILIKFTFELFVCIK
nr:hypothetical protein [Boldiaceae sp.]